MFEDSGRSDRTGRGVLLVLATVVLVASAGCLGFLGGDGGSDERPTATRTATATETATPTATGTATRTPTPTGTPVPGERPPGVGQYGSLNASRLVAAHDDALSGTTYTVRFSVNRSVRAGDEVRNDSQLQTNRIGSDGALLTNYTRRLGGDVAVRENVWTNGSVAANRSAIRGETRYDRPSTDSIRRTVSGTRFLEQYLEVGDFSVHSVDRDTGRVTLTASGPAEDPESLEPGTTVEAFSGTVVVGTDGRVYGVDITANFTTEDGTQAGILVRYDLSGIGDTAVPRPGWVETALDRASPRFVSFPE
jgi:hypothetical protein